MNIGVLRPGVAEMSSTIYTYSRIHSLHITSFDWVTLLQDLFLK